MSVQAAVVSGPGDIALESFPDPELAPGEALVRMELSGICGTDKHIFRGEGTPVRRHVHGDAAGVP